MSSRVTGDRAVTAALDTNVLAYAEGTNGAAMKGRALGLLGTLPADSIVGCGDPCGSRRRGGRLLLSEDVQDGFT